MIKEIKIANTSVFVSDDGSVFTSCGKEKVVQTYPTGYRYITVKQHSYLIHRLVAKAFIDGYSEDLQVHHVNKNRADNHVSNLRVMTMLEHQRLHKQFLPTTKKCEVCGKEFTPAKTKRRRAHVCSTECKVRLDKINAQKRQRAIKQFSLNGDFINRWDSARCVQNETGFFESNINKCCNGKIRSYKGYIWRYA